MTEQKKTGKSDEQIIKDATAKAGIFMVLMMMIIFIMVFAFVIIATGADLSNFGKEIEKLLSTVYPKFASTATAAATGQSTMG